MPYKVKNDLQIGRFTILGSMTVTNRDLIATPPTGAVIWNTSTSVVEVYDGSAWGPLGSGGGTDTNFGTSDITSTGARSHTFDGHNLTIDGTSGTTTISRDNNFGRSSSIESSGSLGRIFFSDQQAGKNRFTTLETSADKATLGMVDIITNDVASVTVEQTTGQKPQLFIRTKELGEGNASVGEVLTLLDASTGEVDFAAAGGGGAAVHAGMHSSPGLTISGDGGTGLIDLFDGGWNVFDPSIMLTGDGETFTIPAGGSGNWKIEFNGSLLPPGGGVTPVVVNLDGIAQYEMTAAKVAALGDPSPFAISYIASLAAGQTISFSTNGQNLAAASLSLIKL